MSNPKTTLGNTAQSGVSTARFIPTLHALAAIAIAFAWGLLVAPSVQAQQTVAVRSQPVRVTVADVATDSTVLTNYVDISGGSNEVDLSISGLPAGAGAVFGKTAFTTSDGTTLTLGTTNVAEGEYLLDINATGAATNTFLLTLQSGRMWNNVTSTWSSAASWVGGTVPGPSDDVIFSQLGAQAAATVTNSTVDASTEIASLRFSQTNGTDRFHNVQINPGVTLSVTGSKGLKLLRDYTGVGAQMDVNFTGEGGTLVVSNANADIAVEIDNTQQHRFDLSGLGTFVADVNRVGFGDYRMYPNYDNLKENGYGGNATFLIPRRFIPFIRLARTNIIRASWVDPNNYTNAGIRNYSLTFENNDTGTTADGNFWFGITNAFLMDSICFVQSSAQAEANNEIAFNAAFAANNPVAYFRGPNGGRMSVFMIADAAGIGASGTSTKALVDFSRGTIDAMVDRLYLGRDRTNSSDNASAEATLTIAAGVVDANTAILGDQDNGNNQNDGLSGTPTGYARGTLNVNSSAKLVVNDELALGYTTADIGDIRQAELGFGRLSIAGDGVVTANKITVGGITKATVLNAAQNTITIAGNGNLIVTNGIGAEDAKLGTLTLNGGSAKLTLTSVSETSTNVHVETLAGTGGIIELASIPGPGTYPLISYNGTSASLSLALPAGFFGFFDNDTANNLLKAVVSTNPPATLIWRGNVNGNWDTTTSNWVDSVSLLPATFVNGDGAVFDDSASASTVTVVGTVIPAGGTLVSNSVLNYTFTGGTIAGLGATIKEGAGSLTMDATHNPPLIISNGTFSVTALGVLNGGVTTYATNTVANAGTINGPVSIQAGAFDNSGTVTTAPGTFSTASGVMITNESAGTMNVSVVGGNNWAIAAGATLLNLGQINNMNGRLNVNGTLIGKGIIHDATGVPNTGGDGRLAINNGGVLIIGTAPGEVDTLSVEGRVDLSNGGQIIVDVDFANPQTNDLLSVDYAGNMQATFVMTNINPSAGSFSNGQTFLIMNGNLGVTLTNASASHTPKVSPVVPGLGLQWDVSGMKVVDTTRTISIIPVPTTPPTLTSAFTGGTNLTLTWSSSDFGYQLQVQTNNLDVGLSTNWVAVPGTEFTNRVDVPIDSANPAVFYRLSNQ